MTRVHGRPSMIVPDIRREEGCVAAGTLQVIGCDEVGRGCIAGPVVAAAVMFEWRRTDRPWLTAGIAVRDSKTLSRKQRQDADAMIRREALSFAIGVVSAADVDKINIHRASLLAMRRALQKMLTAFPDEQSKVFVDGRFTIPNVALPQEAIIGGDGKVFSIAAASIIAKEYRDQLLEQLDKKYPVYGFAQHKGYGTKAHYAALAAHGLSPAHRVTFCHL